MGLLALATACAGSVPQASESTFEAQIGSAIEAGRLEEAIQLARQAAQQYPQSSTLQQMLGAALFRSGQKDEARRAFERAITLDPKVPQNYYNLALVELSDKRYGEATTALRSFLKLEPDNALAHLLLGRALHNQNQTLPAIAEFRRALELAPRLPLAHYHLGFAYQSQGKLDEALAEYRKEIELDPNFYDAYWLAGNIELDHGDLKPAEEHFRRAIELKPGGYEGHYGLARVLTVEKQWAAAIAELEKAVEIHPDDVEPHYALARAYQQMNRRDDAVREFKIVAELHARQRGSSSGIAGQHP